MEQNLDKKTEFKDKLISFYRGNKLKVFSFIGVLLISIISIFIFKANEKKTNSLISEKYLQANLYLTSNNKENSKALFEEIIISKNKFYSILALNSIIDENLISDKKKILTYFKIIEKLKISQEQKDLVFFKKALFLIKNSDIKEGNKLLTDLINKKSKLKNLAEEIIVK